MIPKLLRSVLWSYNLETLDPKKDKYLIITQVLNHGSWKQLQWLIKQYRWQDIKTVVSNPARGSWMPDALNYWVTIFNLKISKQKYQTAIFCLDPQ